MAVGYRLKQTGDEVQDVLDQVQEKTVYEPATQQEDGLMSSSDKRKLDNDVADEELSIPEINELLNF